MACAAWRASRASCICRRFSARSASRRSCSSRTFSAACRAFTWGAGFAAVAAAGSLLRCTAVAADEAALSSPSPCAADAEAPTWVPCGSVCGWLWASGAQRASAAAAALLLGKLCCSGAVLAASTVVSAGPTNQAHKHVTLLPNRHTCNRHT